MGRSHRLQTLNALGRDRSSVPSVAAATLGLLCVILLGFCMCGTCNVSQCTCATSDTAAATSGAARTSGSVRTSGPVRIPLAGSRAGVDSNKFSGFVGVRLVWLVCGWCVWWCVVGCVVVCGGVWFVCGTVWCCVVAVRSGCEPNTMLKRR